MMKDNTEFMNKFNELVGFDKFNSWVKEFIDRYYKYHEAVDFFRIVELHKVCKEQGFTEEQVPQMIEMQNIIVMG